MNFYSYYRLIFAILYPAYSSYKAIKNKDVREYARWMMYWVVFAIFSFIEVFTDIVIGLWLPFYYEIKILFILWLISSYGNGARIMYRNIVHPELNKREQIIDSYISSVKEYWVGLMWKIWQKGAIFFNKALLHFVNFAQMALFQQLQRTSHMDTSNAIEEPTVNLNPKSQRIRRRKAVENNLIID